MQTRFRSAIPLLVMLIALTAAPVALARGGGGDHGGHPSGPDSGPDAPDHDRGPEPGREGGRDADDLDRGPDGAVDNPRAERRRRERRRCGRGERPSRGGLNDCYYGGDGGSGAVEWEGAGATPAPTDAGAAKIASPSPAAGGPVQSFTPAAGEDLVDQLSSARRAWRAKKKQLESANSDWARAQYKAHQTGAKVDPAVVARQERAQAEADAAHAAMGPLVEQARESGVSERVLEMYEGSNSSN